MKNTPSPQASFDSFSPQWLTAGGEPLACAEKEKLLNENLQEIRALCQDALEDAVLMGCDEANIREIFHQLIISLKKPF